MTPLEGWGNFYVIVGSSAGALIGLQFVVMTLIADVPATGSEQQAGSAFSTPSVVHFAAVLLLSAILSAPWNGMAPVRILWGLMGFSGIAYSVLIARRMRQQKAYKPVFEDWLFHLILPLLSYAALAVSGIAARSNPRRALFVIALSALLLLFVGIHNAWDAVTYHVFVRRRDRR